MKKIDQAWFSLSLWRSEIASYISLAVDVIAQIGAARQQVSTPEDLEDQRRAEANQNVFDNPSSPFVRHLDWFSSSWVLCVDAAIELRHFTSENQPFREKE